MRLKQKELKAIARAFKTHLEPLNGELYLFGSRTDDTKKGGDIDLLVIVPNGSSDTIKAEQVRIIDQIHNEIGEQRIDVTVATTEALKSDPFLKSISPTLVRIKIEDTHSPITLPNL